MGLVDFTDEQFLCRWLQSRNLCPSLTWIARAGADTDSKSPLRLQVDAQQIDERANLHKAASLFTR